jgi:hypothetical protein
MQNDDAMTIGFIAAGFVWTIWWNLDWRRYIKFYRIKGPVYPLWVQLPFRTFFAICSLGAAVELGRQLLYRGHTVQFYFKSLLAAGAWFGVIAFMVVVAESMMKSRESKANPPE